MKKLLILAPALLIFAGCATQQAPTMGTRYGIDSQGNLTQQQYVIPAPPADNRLLETVAVIGLGLVGFYFIGEVFDVWDKEPAPAAAPPSNGLVPTAGQTSWSTDYLVPTYVPVSSGASIQPVSFEE